MTPRALGAVDTVQDFLRGTLLEVVLLVLTALLAARLLTYVGSRITERIDATARESDALVRSEAAKHRHAVAQVLTYIGVVLVWAVTAVLVADRLRIPITGLVAPATVAGVALGFGAQRVVQDVLAGFFLITERQYGFGDVVLLVPTGKPDGVTGTVEDLSLRVTRLRTANGEVVIVPNGQITYVTNLSRDWARAAIDVPVPLTSDISRVNDLLHEVGVAAYADPELRPLLLDEPSVMGVEALDIDEVTVRVVARTLPGKQFEVGRALRVRIAVALRSEGITLPPGALDTGAPTGISP